MKPTSFSTVIKGALIALVALACGGTAALAQATRTWVSGVGDDANPCSRTAPCKTFAGAISKTAAGGEISVLDPGGFGSVTITKSITLNGDGTLASILHSGTNGININGAGIKVNLRNISLNGAGVTLGVNAINISDASEVNIENCTIEGNSGVGINIAPTAVCGVTIKNTTIRGCAGGAVFARPNAATGAAVNISKSSMNDSLFGFRADENVKAVLDDCVLAGNNGNGVVLAPSAIASKVSVNRCTINDTGGFGIIASNALSTAFISNNAIFNNTTGIGVTGGGLMISAGNNNIKGNTADTSGGAPTSTPGGL